MVGVVLVVFFRCRGDIDKVDLRSGLGIRSSSTSGDDWSLVSTRVAGVGRRLRICSAASGSRCGSSSGTVNWIFRGLLSCSMARGPAAAGLGLGRARSLSAALRPRPQPGSRLAAPSSARPTRPGDYAAADWLRTAPPGPLLPQSRALTPSWLHWLRRGSPPLRLESQTGASRCPSPSAGGRPDSSDQRDEQATAAWAEEAPLGSWK